MKPVIATIIVCVPLLSFGADAPKDDPFYKIRSELNRRTNGAMLVATASASETDADRIEIQWSLDYDGPRPPLTILRPSLELATCSQTQVIVYARPAGGRPHEMILSSPLQHGKYWAPQGWFVTVEKGKTTTGVIPIRVSEIKAFFLKNWPDRFRESPPPEVRIQLVHRPTDRGGQYNLDAWTGELYSAVILVELKKW